METYRDLYRTVCSYENLELAWRRARKGKTLKNCVINFEADLENNLKQLKLELESFTYAPAPLNTFIIRDPKTRIISASHFRDRVVHHAICNIIAPIFEKDFIYDSFANQKNKGTHKAIKRFEKFTRKVYSERAHPLKSGQRKPSKSDSGYVLKADVKHYFDTIDHDTLLQIITQKIKDEDLIWLIKTILRNHKSEVRGRGMPLGNLTSQFFANVYLHKLDMFVKHKLKAKYYIRYVDDFVILHKNKKILEKWKDAIGIILKSDLKIELHPEKSRIIQLKRGITLLGFRVFSKYKLVKKSNVKRIWKRIETFKLKYNKDEIEIRQIIQSLEGWFTYARFANTYNLRKRIETEFNNQFLSEYRLLI